MALAQELKQKQEVEAAREKTETVEEEEDDDDEQEKEVVEAAETEKYFSSESAEAMIADPFYKEDPVLSMVQIMNLIDPKKMFDDKLTELPEEDNDDPNLSEREKKL